MSNAVIADASNPFGNIRLDAVGLLALADLRSIARWTTITGSASLIDTLYLAPGIHQQQQAPELNGGEYPPTGALTSGYVFRVENEATVHFLQRIGVTGHLTNIFVDPPPRTWIGRCKSGWKSPGLVPLLMYMLGPLMTIVSLIIVGLIGDWWALGILFMLMLARFCNVVVLRRRSKIGWKGIPEPGVYGDLLILLSQDRWIRMRGLVDDLKAVTSGQWLRDTRPLEEFVITTTTMLVYLAAALASNSTTAGNLILLLLLLISAALLELINGLSTGQRLYGRVLRVKGEPVSYVRRLDLVDQLIKESRRDDWALRLGMISKSKLDPGGGTKQAVL